MHFDCPTCQQRLAVEDDRTGEHLPCPACERVIRVPRVPIVIYKGRRNPGSVRLVPIPASARMFRRGSLAERVAALQSAQSPRAQEPLWL